jgi:hypothetical protein
VDAAELLRGDAPFIVDTSAWWRFSSLPSTLFQSPDPPIRPDEHHSHRHFFEYLGIVPSDRRRESIEATV